MTSAIIFCKLTVQANNKLLITYSDNKLLSIDPCDITHTVFFKTLYVILHNLPCYFKKLNIKINKSEERFVNFWSDFNDNDYFYDTRGYIRINYIKLSIDKYLVGIPVKNGSTVILHIYVNINIK